MNMRYMAGYLLLLLLIPPADAKEVVAEPGLVLPRVVMDGLGSYRKSGPEAGVKAWYRHSVIEKSDTERVLVKELKKVHRVYGNMRGFHAVDITNWTPTTQVVYLTTDLEEGPLFWRFLVFKKPTRHVVLSARFALEPEDVFPEELVEWLLTTEHTRLRQGYGGQAEIRRENGSEE